MTTPSPEYSLPSSYPDWMRDPAIAGEQIASNMERLRAPSYSADQIRETLSNHPNVVHDPAPSWERAQHFVNAMGFKPKPRLIFSSMPDGEFHRLMRKSGIYWPPGIAGRAIHEVGADIIYLPEVDKTDFSVESVIVHEGAHTLKGFMPAQAYEEGQAGLFEDAYNLLSGSPLRYSEIKPPYTLQNLGSVMMSRLCNDNPGLIKILVERDGTPKSYSNILTSMYEILGFERFWDNGGIFVLSSPDRIPEGMKDYVTDEGRLHGIADMKNLMGAIGKLVADYESRTGYSFGFDEAICRRVGATALLANNAETYPAGSPGTNSSPEDAVTTSLRRITETVRSDRG